MPKLSFGDRLRYRFDNIFSRGTVALIGLLALASLGVIIVISLVVKLAGLAPDVELPELVWKALMRTLDAGTHGRRRGRMALSLCHARGYTGRDFHHQQPDWYLDDRPGGAVG